MSYFASKYVRLITGIPVRDTTAGFVGYKREVLENFDFDKIKFVGYAFQIEMKYVAWKKTFRIKEVPIIFTDRIKGKSKMHGGIISEAAWGVLKMRFSRFKKKRKIKKLKLLIFILFIMIGLSACKEKTASTEDILDKNTYKAVLKEIILANSAAQQLKNKDTSVYKKSWD